MGLPLNTNIWLILFQSRRIVLELKRDFEELIFRYNYRTNYFILTSFYFLIIIDGLRQASDLGVPKDDKAKQISIRTQERDNFLVVAVSSIKR